MVEVRDKKVIQRVLDAYMLNLGGVLELGGPEFLVAVIVRRGGEFQGQVHKGGFIIEGCRPTTANVLEGDGEVEMDSVEITGTFRNIETPVKVMVKDKSYALANGDTNYQRPLGSVKLSDIASVQLLSASVLQCEPRQKREPVAGRENGVLEGPKSSD